MSYRQGSLFTKNSISLKLNLVGCINVTAVLMDDASLFFIIVLNCGIIKIQVLASVVVVQVTIIRLQDNCKLIYLRTLYQSDGAIYQALEIQVIDAGKLIKGKRKI